MIRKTFPLGDPLTNLVTEYFQNPNGQQFILVSIDTYSTGDAHERPTNTLIYVHELGRVPNFPKPRNDVVHHAFMVFVGVLTLEEYK